MSITCGIDIIEVSRIKKVAERFGQRFLNRIFTDRELEYCSAGKSLKWPSLAARFAAKEAVSKALGTGFSCGVRPREIEILSDNSRRPEVSLSGGALKKYKETGAKEISISLSHTASHAIAVVILEI